VARGDENVLALCAAEGIAWVPYFPLGGSDDTIAVTTT
jgi:pyridoxine 4-dehydrogenase